MSAVDPSHLSPSHKACSLFYEQTVAQYHSASSPIWKEMSRLKLIDSQGNPRSLAIEDWTEDRFSSMKSQQRKSAAEELSNTKQRIKSIFYQLNNIHQPLEEAAFFLDEMIAAKFSIPLDENLVSKWGMDLLDKEEHIKLHLDHLEFCLDRIKELTKNLSEIKSEEKPESSPGHSDQQGIPSLDKMSFSELDQKEKKLAIRSKIGPRLSLDELQRQRDKDLRADKPETMGPHSAPDSDPSVPHKHKHRRRALSNFPNI